MHVNQWLDGEENVMADYVEVTLVIRGRIYSSRSQIKMHDWGEGEGWDRLVVLIAKAAHRVSKRFNQYLNQTDVDTSSNQPMHADADKAGAGDGCC